MSETAKMIPIKVVIFLLITILLSVACVNLISAVVVKSVDQLELSPGEEGNLEVIVENILQDTAEDVSFSINLQQTPFISLGGSEDSVDEIDEDDDERFIFVIKAANDITPGDYAVPYTLSYTIKDEIKQKSGTIGISVVAETDLGFSVSVENPIVGEKGIINIKIINKGFADAKFVNVKLIPEDFTILSEREVYIGNIESDDFDTASFDVLFNRKNTNLLAIIEYTDFNNEKVIRNIEQPIDVYTTEEAIERGIKEKSSTILIIVIIVLVIIILIAIRQFRKYRRHKKSLLARKQEKA